MHSDVGPARGRCDWLGCPRAAVGSPWHVKGPLRGSQFGAGQSGRGKSSRAANLARHADTTLTAVKKGKAAARRLSVSMMDL
ncbi:hypothetical protein BraRD5C2_14450 [Bradyrhizobium sp. RD5-C2]|nr:hypothetical protein BraRD5C2_14450 [Bradyrhizobium sp. RD5-C2]